MNDLLKKCQELTELADNHFYGLNGKDKNIIEAKNIYKESAELGCEDGAYKLSYIIHFIGKINDENKRYSKLLKVFAEYGDAIAIEELQKLSLKNEKPTSNQQREYNQIDEAFDDLRISAYTNNSTELFTNIEDTRQTRLKKIKTIISSYLQKKSQSTNSILTLSIIQINRKYAHFGATIEEIHNKVNLVPTLRYMVNLNGHFKSCDYEHEIQNTINKLLTYETKESTVLNNFYRDLKIKYLTGNYILLNIQNGKNIIEYSFKDNMAEKYKLIHKKHKNVLEHWLNGGEIVGESWSRYFLSDYNENENYTIYRGTDYTEDSELKDYMEKNGVGKYFNIVANIENITKDEILTRYDNIINYLAHIGLLTYCETRELKNNTAVTGYRKCYYKYV